MIECSRKYVGMDRKMIFLNRDYGIMYKDEIQE